MKFIIPAKTGSERCKDKNWRPFWGDFSLVDVLINKLLRVAAAEDIWVSTNEINPLPGVQNIQRPDHLAHNSTPMSEVVRWHAENIPGDDDIAWCQVINPLFDEYPQAIQAWHDADEEGFDSLSVIYPISGYVLDSHHQPQGFGFGAFQCPTQELPPHYRYPCTLNFATRETALKHGYIGPGCAWYEASGPFIDIKTDEDFEAAQVLYAAKMEVAV